MVPLIALLRGQSSRYSLLCPPWFYYYGTTPIIFIVRHMEMLVFAKIRNLCLNKEHLSLPHACLLLLRIATFVLLSSSYWPDRCLIASSCPFSFTSRARCMWSKFVTPVFIYFVLIPRDVFEEHNYIRVGEIEVFLCTVALTEVIISP